ncbi:hypothetical protein UQ64_19000 [Paenibacillus etheri]|uniref:Uncharacterized protein n=1 Tax=Paenibacillus etheri TaxID=1306852 RepID=A0A0W1AWD4_9BACL|nr:hypothetical protein UQ64_19000 [Paenibacillus etheri]
MNVASWFVNIASWFVIVASLVFDCSELVSNYRDFGFQLQQATFPITPSYKVFFGKTDKPESTERRVQ